MKIYKHLTANAINLVPFDFIRELSMEAYLIENPMVLTLDDDNFDEIEIIEDELRFTSTIKTQSCNGRIDLLGYYNSSNTLAIIEIKKDEINLKNINQLTNYLKNRNKIFESIKEKNQDINSPKWIGILVGTSISSDLIKFIEDGNRLDIEGSLIPLVAVIIKRYKSEDGQFFIATDTYQNIKNKNNKNFDKYIFNEKKFGKNRLILNVLSHHAQNNSHLTFADFKQLFPDSIQGSSYGVFTTVEEANSINNSGGRMRYFTKPDELIKLSDKTISVCNQWHITNIKTAIDIFKKLGYTILNT